MMKKKASCGSGNGNRARIRQYRVFSFGEGLRVSRFIGETLAPEAFQSDVSATNVVYAQPFSVAVAEIKLGQVAVQVPLADMEVSSR